MNENNVLKVFIVEDDKDIQGDLRERIAFENLGRVDFVMAETLSEAAKKFDEHSGKFDVVIMDGRMPPGDPIYDGQSGTDLVEKFVASGFDGQKIIPASGDQDLNKAMQELGCFPNEDGKAAAGKLACVILQKVITARTVASSENGSSGSGETPADPRKPSQLANRKLEF